MEDVKRGAEAIKLIYYFPISVFSLLPFIANYLMQRFHSVYWLFHLKL